MALAQDTSDNHITRLKDIFESSSLEEYKILNLPTFKFEMREENFIWYVKQIFKKKSSIPYDGQVRM